MELWGVALPDEELSAAEREEISFWQKKPVPAVQEVWRRMDDVWKQMGLMDTATDEELGHYYHHPIWLINGVFTAADPLSARQRAAIADFLVSAGCQRIADYGGGFGALAMDIARRYPAIHTELVEPYPRPAAARLWRLLPNLYPAPDLTGLYDAIVAEDVLEHVRDPVGLAGHIAEALSPQGIGLFANCFFPVIRCHLPETFFLRHTFAWVVAPLGLVHEGHLPNVEHALVFRRNDATPDLQAARRRAAWARLAALVFNPAIHGAWTLKVALLGTRKVPS